MTDTITPHPNRRWTLRLQFSLRLLLLALTAFAIGFPIWYRWPFEETDYQYPGGDKTRPPMGKSVKTWRRSWGGGKASNTAARSRSTKTDAFGGSSAS